jgi:hypothetical protein
VTVQAPGLERALAIEAIEATPEEIRAFFAAQGKAVLTFSGYSGAGYENRPAMLETASRILDQADPATTMVNIGATAEGIGEVYEVAKRRGFRNSGIVSTQAQDIRAPLSPWVDVVFFVRDAGWGGFLPGTRTLSPTSRAMVENSDWIVAIGGGAVTHDELVVAQREGKRVQFFAADMNHQAAREKAVQEGRPPPSDFAGLASTALQEPPGRPPVSP